MMNGMPMPHQAEAPESESGEGGGLSDLVFGIQKQLTDLLSALDKVAPDAKAELGQIVDAYRSFVEDKLGAPQGKGPMPPTGSVSPEAGANPNARPI